MTVMPLVEVEAPRTGKISKNGLRVLIEEKICYKIIYYTLYLKANRQKLCYQVRIYIYEKLTFQKGVLNRLGPNHQKSSL